MKKQWTLFLAIFMAISLHAQDIPRKKVYKKHEATDVAHNSLKPYNTEKNANYKGMKIESFYLEMRDGVKLAIDLYMPKGLKPGTKIPTVVRQTRYWRRPEIRGIFKVFSNGLIGRTAKLIDLFVANGYAIVNVDVRGSGASFGYRPHPWTEDEIKDGKEIIDWIIQQDWSNGKVGSVGISYGGTTAEFLATNQHPALKAVVLMFSLFDVYEDNAFPGGIHNRWFTQNWGDANAMMDKNELPPNAEKYKWLIKGVAPVKGERKTFREAVASHSNNRNVHDGALTVDFRNDVPSDSFIQSIDAFSPHNFADLVDNSGAAVYSYSGWHDGAYQHAAIKRHLNLSNPQNKLMLGPWEHGGAFNISPYTRSEAGFDHGAEILKFFDYHLKGIENGLYDEPPVHYFCVGEEKWNGAQQWPPEGLSTQTFHLTDQKKLDAQKPQGAQKQLSYKENNEFGTGTVNRWTAVNGKVKNPYTYHDWTQRSEPLLHFSSETLDAALKMTGHPKVKIFAASNKNDGALFVYLEEVTAEGKVYQVTEGQLRASHRKTDGGIYKEVTPARSHNSSMAAEVKPNEVMELSFDLLPVSWEFQKGSKVRISISGGDKDLFEIIEPAGYEWTLYFGEEYPSQVILPIEQ